MSRVRANVWKIYAFKLLSDFLMIVPIILPFYKACGLTVTRFLVGQAVFSAGAPGSSSGSAPRSRRSPAGSSRSSRCGCPCT